MPSEPDSKSLPPGAAAVPAAGMGGVAALAGGVAVAAGRGAEAVVVKGSWPCIASLTAKIAETSRNIPATPAANHRSVWPAEMPLGGWSCGALLDREFMVERAWIRYCSGF
jgi:hypothetical protein